MNTRVDTWNGRRTAVSDGSFARLVDRTEQLIVQDWIVPGGRVLFSAIFLTAAITHFSPQVIAYATQMGVPFARVLVPFSGAMAGAGALSVMLG
jgi:uncharacterized membrane protein YphA (DoxX/SURF4 family)